MDMLITVPHNSPAKAAFGAATMAQAEEWRTAYLVALANAGIFLILALTMFWLEPNSLLVALSAPTLFSFGALLSFLLMIRSGGALSTIAWFVLGSGIFFGIGVVVGGLDPDPESVHFVSEYILFRDLFRINLLNASSVLIVLAVAYPLANSSEIKIIGQEGMGLAVMFRYLLKIFPLVMAIFIIGVGLQFVFFPVPDNLTLRSVVSVLYAFIPFFCFLVGMLWRSIPWGLQLIAGCGLFLEVVNGLLNFSKYAVISTVLALVVGTWMTRRTAKQLLLCLIMLGVIYGVIAPIVTSSRAHIDYDPAMNSPATRLAILSDVLLGDSIEADSEQRILSRFSVPFIQGYLVEEYEHGLPGNSLDDFWVALIPRVLWPDKPNITRFGAELHGQYLSLDNPASALAPTYSAEAYWNYGPLGLIVVSVLLGLELGWFTRRWQLALAGRDSAFYLIAFPAALLASYVETWVAASYIGGFVTLVVIWLIARLVFSCYRIGVEQKFA